ncbi:MAG: flagellar basal body P-ring protein FlgI [Planctomycetes bacterium]|nr:flagellar basal body P-ring protein FlgI [Planctomycetota bacterium]
MPYRCTALSIATLLTLACLPACQTTPTAKPKTVQPTVNREVPAPLRGIVGSATTITGVEPVLVSGYGLVVGLNGTGGGALPDRIRSSMERTMGLQGIGRAERNDDFATSGLSPAQLLRDKNVAVVLVQAAIPPGLPAGATFDVAVTALNASSLDGGRLWTTDLQIGDPALVGGVQTRKLASASGPIFINPFNEPGKERTGITRFVGRILDGGVVREPFALELRLDNPSHSMARQIAAALNERFPPGPGDKTDIARGRNDSIVAVTVPNEYRKKPGDFLELMLSVPIDAYTPSEELAKRTIDDIKAQPALAPRLALCLEGIGRPDRTLPIIRSLYDFSELAPRLAGLQAGARLGDVLAAPHLRELAKSGAPGERTTAIELLADLGAGPTVDQALKELLTEKDLAIRAAAYEALMSRAVKVQANRIGQAQSFGTDANGRRLSLAEIQMRAEANVPPGLLQGVQRRAIGGKFLLDLVPFGDPMIYITQQGQPRVVLFGENLEIPRPFLVAAWSGRLLIASDASGDPIRIRYQPPESASGPNAGPTSPRTITVNGGLPALIDALARNPSPEESRPALGLTYSEVVGVLYEIHQQRALACAFVTERERLQAQIYAAARSVERRDRPETLKQKSEVVVIEQPLAPIGSPEARPTDVPPTQVPIPMGDGNTTRDTARPGTRPE